MIKQNTTVYKKVLPTKPFEKLSASYLEENEILSKKKTAQKEQKPEFSQLFTCFMEVFL